MVIGDSTKSTNTVTRTTGRYRDLILSLGIFITLLTAVLAYTVYGSIQAQRNTTLIAVTNHVANDVQQVIKDLFDMQVSYGEDINSPHAVSVLKRLNQQIVDIDVKLKLLENGGEAIIDDKGNKATLDKVTDPKLLEPLQATRKQWVLLEPKLKDYLAVATDITKDASIPLSIAGEQAKISTLSINDSLSLLTTEAFQATEVQNNKQNIVRLGLIGASIIYFIAFISFFIRRLRRADEEAIAAQKETAEIMANVNTGLFLLDKELKIGNQYSNELVNIMGKTTNIGGENLTKLLRHKVSDKDLETTESFIKQLYNPRVKEKLVNDLNPLKKVMLNADDSVVGGRYLDFKFSRVYQEKEIEKILVTVQDVTNQVRLEQRLEHERAQNDLQMEMLTTILNVSPAIINDFIRNTKENIVKINDILKVSGSSQAELEDKLARMYRIMHSLKGEASALKLHSFTTIAQNFEEKLKGLQNQGKLTGNDFLPLTIHLDELLNLSNTIEALGQRINQNTTVKNTETAASVAVVNPVISSIIPETAPIAGLNAFYEQFANTIAERNGKQVKLQSVGLDEVKLSSDLTQRLKEIIVQLVRNAVVHGIEKPEQRLANNKPAIGNIHLNLSEAEDSYRLIIEDDGAGINYEAIRQKAIEMGFSAEDVAAWDRQKLTGLLFKSGFSTKSEVDEDSGRGVGMDIIKDNVQSLGGNLGIDTKEGLSTRFTIKVPKKSNLE